MPATVLPAPLADVASDVPEGTTLDARRRMRTPDRDARRGRSRLARLDRRRRRPAATSR